MVLLRSSFIIIVVLVIYLFSFENVKSQMTIIKQDSENRKTITFPIERKKGTGFEYEQHGERRILSHGPPPFKEFAMARKESDGVFFANLRIGTPQQMFSAIVDTGSSTIAIPCKGCNCGPKHSTFDYSKSSTAVKTGDRYSQCYSEGRYVMFFFLNLWKKFK